MSTVCIHHSLYDIIFEAGITYLSFKTTVDDIEWSNSWRVDCVETFTSRYHITSLHRLSIKTTNIEWSKISEG